MSFLSPPHLVDNEAGIVDKRRWKICANAHYRASVLLNILRFSSDLKDSINFFVDIN